MNSDNALVVAGIAAQIAGGLTGRIAEIGPRGVAEMAVNLAVEILAIAEEKTAVEIGNEDPR